MVRIEVAEDAGAAAARAAGIIADAIAAAAPGPFTLAVSGGSTPGTMFRILAAGDDLPWDGVGIWQVDERLAPPGPDRNAAFLDSDLPGRVAFHPMDVDAPDPDAAAVAYAAGLPERFDLVHLGLGADGHTASLVPGDPTAVVRDRDVVVTAPYRGYRRMTITAPVIERAALVLFLVTGADKRGALALLRAGDPSIPAGALRLAEAVVVADREAAGR